MGLMDKFKNLFTDEEIIEEEIEEEPVKIKEIKKEETKEHKLPTFMREKIEKEEKKHKEKPHKEIKDDEKNEERTNSEEVKDIIEEIKVEKSKEFKFPVFDESDFIEPTITSRVAKRERAEEIKKSEIKPELNIKKTQDNVIKTETKVSKLYKDKKEPEKEDKRFKASPIISPIFGVLDKNYVPDDVETRKGGDYEKSRHSKNVDFDSVRKKAYGNEKTLEEDIKDNLICENCEYLKKAKSCKKSKEKESDNVMYEALCENRKEDNNDITIDEATENYFDYGKVYEKKQDIDPIYLDEEDEEQVKIINHEEEEPKKEKKEVPPVKSSINLLSTIKKSAGEEKVDNNSKDLELTGDLFNLIDSMYEERDD